MIRNYQRSSILLGCVASLCAMVAGCSVAEPGATDPGATEPGTTEHVGRTEAPITNGTHWSTGTRSAAAVYTSVNGSWRLCSGMVIQSWWGWSAVLTARHCLTTSGGSGGTLVAAGNVRVATGDYPGATPPSSAYTPSSISAPSPYSDVSHDYALLWIGAELPIDSTFTFIDRGSIQELSSKKTGVSGYGMNGTSAGGEFSEAGFTLVNWYGTPPSGVGNVTFMNTGTNRLTGGAAYLEKGDDGAVMTAFCTNWDCGGSAWWTEMVGVVAQVGAHNAWSAASAVAGFADWLQDELWVNYISSVNTPANHIGANGLCEGCWIWGRDAGDSDYTRWSYHSNTQELKVWNTNYCFAPEAGATGWPVIYTCNGSAEQKWTVSGRQIKNVSTGQCLIDSGDWPYLGTCTGAAAGEFLFNGQY
jgi:hypothetical protein